MSMFIRSSMYCWAVVYLNLKASNFWSLLRRSFTFWFDVSVLLNAMFICFVCVFRVSINDCWCAGWILLLSTITLHLLVVIYEESFSISWSCEWKFFDLLIYPFVQPTFVLRKCDWELLLLFVLQVVLIHGSLSLLERSEYLKHRWLGAWCLRWCFLEFLSLFR